MIVGHPHEKCRVGQDHFLDSQNVRCVFHECFTLYASAAMDRDTRRMNFAMAKTQTERG